VVSGGKVLHFSKCLFVVGQQKFSHTVCFFISSSPDGVCSSAIRGLDVNGDSSILCTRVK